MDSFWREPVLRKILLLCMALVLLAGCAKKKVEPQSRDSKLAEAAFAIVEDMRAAYVGKDFEGLRRFCAEGGCRGLKRGLGGFESAELVLSPRWVEIEGDTLTVNIAWKGTWVVGGETRKGRGMAVFVFEGRPLGLRQILRSSPFRTPE